ncbi:MAG TPA: hypothetical protein VFE32_11620 [Puia sp.]|jgi:hypothetical protein|nr:hypothetical protein [Puia sp.]
MKKALIGAVALIIVGLITYMGVRYSTDHAHASPSVSQTSTKGSNVAVTGDSNNVVAGNSGPTVVSFGQTGGVTALNYYKITQITQVIASHPASTPDHTSGPAYQIDTAKKTITFHPKSGTWGNPFVAVPKKELGPVPPHLSVEGQSSLAVSESTIIFEGDTLQELSSTIAASPQSQYTLRYINLPSYFLFGDRSGPTYKAAHLDQ